MKVTDNPLVALIEECIYLRDSAQAILSEPSEDLTRLEGLTLLALTESGEKLTIPQIGRNLGHTRQVIQRTVKRLVELELVRKLPNPHHKTADLVEPTEKGMAYYHRLGEQLGAVVGSLFTADDMATCKRIAAEMKKIRLVIEQRQKV